MRAKEVEKVSFPQYNSKKEEGPSQDGDYTILTRPLVFWRCTVSLQTAQEQDVHDARAHEQEDA